MDLIEDIDNPSIPIAQACDALGVSRATLYRRTTAPRPPSIAVRAPNPRRLSEGERNAVLDTLHSEPFVDQPPRILEHRLVLGGEAGDQIGADRDLGPGHLQPLNQRDRLRAVVAALHPREDHVVAGLQREMEMRQHPRLMRDQVEQPVVDLDAVERGQAQALQPGHIPEDAFDEQAHADGR